MPRTLSQPGYAPDCNSRFYQIQASVWSLVRFIYDIDHTCMHCGYTNYTSESDVRSCEATKAVAKKAQKKYPVEASEFSLGFLSNCFSASWLRGSLNFTSICIMLSLPGLTKFLSTFAHKFFVFCFCFYSLQLKENRPQRARNKSEMKTWQQLTSIPK